MGLMQPSLSRLGALAHYVIARTEPSELGATKLNKILWFSDIAYYRRHGKSITGLSHYVRMPKGPMPPDINRELRHLGRHGLIVERPAKVFTYTRREFVWLKEPDVKVFTSEEIDTVGIFTEIIRKQSAEYISDVTHEDPLWLELENGDPMPIGAASIISRAPSIKDLAWAEAQS